MLKMEQHLNITMSGFPQDLTPWDYQCLRPKGGRLTTRDKQVLKASEESGQRRLDTGRVTGRGRNQWATILASILT